MLSPCGDGDGMARGWRGDGEGLASDDGDAGECACKSIGSFDAATSDDPSLCRGLSQPARASCPRGLIRRDESNRTLLFPGGSDPWTPRGRRRNANHFKGWHRCAHILASSSLHTNRASIPPLQRHVWTGCIHRLEVLQRYPSAAHRTQRSLESAIEEQQEHH